MNLGPIAQRVDEGSQLQTCSSFRPVSAGVYNLSIDTRDCLGGLEVLFVGQTDDVREFHPILFALVSVTVVISGDSHLEEAQLYSFILDLGGYILARRLNRRLLVAC